MPLADIEGARRVSDPSLPPGAAFWVRLHSRPQGLYLVCEVAAEAEVHDDLKYIQSGELLEHHVKIHIHILNAVTLNRKLYLNCN